jgi:peptide/nickel transport system substrate-binding protein
MVGAVACSSSGSSKTSGSATTQAAGPTTTASTGSTQAPAATAPTDADTNATVRASFVFVPTTLNPYKEPNPATFAYNTLLYDRLVKEDHSGTKILPMLAKSWEFTPDGATLTMHLRDDATFTDGTPIRADAVKFSLDQAKSVTSSLLAGPLAAVDTVTVVDPLTVAIHMAQPTSMILYFLATTSGAVLNPAKVNASTDWSNGPPLGAGSGGYTVASYVPGQKIVMQRRTTPYWDPTAALVKEWDMQVIAEPATALNGLTTGQLEIAGLMNAVLDTTQKQIDAAGLQLLKVYGGQSKMLTMNTNLAPLKDVRVRQAMAYGVDWQTITNNVFANGSKPADFQFFFQGEPGYQPGGSGYSYDANKAKALLQQAGVTNLNLNVGVPTQRDQSGLEAAKAQLAPLGINITIVSVPNTDINSSIINGKIDAFFDTTSAQRPLPLLLTNYFVSAARGALAGADVPMLQQLLSKVTDPAANAAAVASASQAAVQFANQQLWSIPVTFEPTLFGAKKTVKGLDNMEAGVIGQWTLRDVYMTK